MCAVILLTLQSIAINRLAGLPYPLWAPLQTSAITNDGSGEKRRQGRVVRIMKTFIFAIHFLLTKTTAILATFWV
jgi:hypothetical protein